MSGETKNARTNEDVNKCYRWGRGEDVVTHGKLYVFLPVCQIASPSQRGTIIAARKFMASLRIWNSFNVRKRGREDDSELEKVKPQCG